MVFSPLPGHARWSTLATALLIAAVVTWRTRRPLRAALAVIAWLALYEVVWQGCDVVAHRANVVNYGWLSLAVVAWPLLAFQAGIRPHPIGAAVCAAGFLVWLALGFDYNWIGQPGPIRPVPEALNLVTKTALGLAYLAGALRPGTEPARSARAGSRA